MCLPLPGPLGSLQVLRPAQQSVQHPGPALVTLTWLGEAQGTEDPGYFVLLHGALLPWPKATFPQALTPRRA